MHQVVHRREIGTAASMGVQVRPGEVEPVEPATLISAEYTCGGTDDTLQATDR